ncbi:MAG TPA: exopolyphosphatase [Pelobium sp.]|nr:exopolyphosphatase [Pelobium sp.]
MRYAAIDIGSNAIRLLIASILTHDGKTTFKKTSLIRVPLRLGDNAFIDHRISDQKAEELVKAMIAFKNLMDVYHVEDYMACATSALREAENGAEIVQKIKEKAGINMEIVGGQKEANIIYSSHIDQAFDRDKNYLYIDVGGGSTELSIFSEGKPMASKSFNLGTIRILDGQDKAETWEDLKNWIDTETKSYKELIGIGTGGNINKLFRLAGEKEGEPLSYTKLKAQCVHLNSFTLKERIVDLGLNHDRADVIIPACQIFLTVMSSASIEQIHVPKVGMVDGIINLLIEKNFKN